MASLNPLSFHREYKWFNKTHRIKPIYLLLLLPQLFMGCASTLNAPQRKQKLINSHSLQVGANWGGIIDDTKIDAVSGATRNCLHIGYHPTLHIRGHLLETGFDLLNFKQTFSYTGHESLYKGKRDFRYTQFGIPLSYNFQLFRDANHEAQLLLKLGISASYRIADKITEQGQLPCYAFDHFSMGPAFGISSTPFSLNDQFSLGLYLDFMLGSNVYSDDFSAADGIGNMSNIKFGMIVKMK